VFGEKYTLRFEPVEVDDGALAQALLENLKVCIIPFPLSHSPTFGRLTLTLTSTALERSLTSKRPNIHEIKAHGFFSSVDWEATAARSQPAPVTPRIPTPSPPPKTYRISFGNDPMPSFMFTSSNFR
jgi:hypothetical protein